MVSTDLVECKNNSGGGKWLIHRNIRRQIILPVTIVLVAMGYALMIASGYAYQNLLIWGFAFYVGFGVAKIDSLEKIVNHEAVFAIALLAFVVLCCVYDKQSESNLYDMVKLSNGLFSFVCLFNICQRLKLQNNVHSMLMLFGSNSLAIYLMHLLFVYWSKDIDMTLLFESNQWLLTIVDCAVAVVISFACVVLYKVLTTNKYIAFILFGKIIRKQ